MLQVSDRAVDMLAALRAQEQPSSGQGIALVPTAEGALGLALIEPQPEDQVIERDGEPVVIVPQPVAAQLDGWVLDVTGVPGDEQLILGPPEENIAPM